MSRSCGWRKRTWVSEEPDSGNKTYRRKRVTQKPKYSMHRCSQLSPLFLLYFSSNPDVCNHYIVSPQVFQGVTFHFFKSNQTRRIADSCLRFAQKKKMEFSEGKKNEKRFIFAIMWHFPRIPQVPWPKYFPACTCPCWAASRDSREWTIRNKIY